MALCPILIKEIFYFVSVTLILNSRNQGYALCMNLSRLKSYEFRPPALVLMLLLLALYL